jgi:hypothetical protein
MSDKKQSQPEQDLAWIDEVGGVKFMQELINKYGAAHAVRFFGWCVAVGAVIREGESLNAAADRLVRLGFAQTSAYRAIKEIKEFQEHLATRIEAPISVHDIVAGLSKEDFSTDGKKPA